MVEGSQHHWGHMSQAEGTTESHRCLTCYEPGLLYQTEGWSLTETKGEVLKRDNILNPVITMHIRFEQEKQLISNTKHRDRKQENPSRQTQKQAKK